MSKHAFLTATPIIRQVPGQIAGQMVNVHIDASGVIFRIRDGATNLTKLTWAQMFEMSVDVTRTSLLSTIKKEKERSRKTSA